MVRFLYSISSKVFEKVFVVLDRLLDIIIFFTVLKLWKIFRFNMVVLEVEIFYDQIFHNISLYLIFLFLFTGEYIEKILCRSGIWWTAVINTLMVRAELLLYVSLICVKYIIHQLSSFLFFLIYYSINFFCIKFFIWCVVCIDLRLAC